ncbi:hypothetical protein [Campylobacter fetus]|uniref:hypothetical protein n=1 Tax=Campylobacter fetus TaxID=196 RepID=UPI0011C704C2|nr:hypothetical protein [Campylobacter fetus]EAJ1232660.1 hypothetical protein [Campylobacter fetus]EAK0414847.1 hypothetical protein [Campylobacter fetus]TXF08808.1 hypothetical protein FPD25_03730 [Campylobacter fetus subsp. fetus]HDX6330712.1 hypothetical protein [Campylobacter fetus subsp. venerealis]
MSKVLIRNVIANKTFGFVLPCDVDTATTFCTNNLDGTYSIFQAKDPVDKGIAQGSNLVTVTGKSAAGFKHTFQFSARANLNEDEIKTALLNKTFNNVKFDEVYIIGLKAEIAAGTPAP